MWVVNAKGTQVINAEQVKMFEIKECFPNKGNYKAGLVAVFDFPPPCENIVTLEVYRSRKEAQEVLDDLIKAMWNKESVYEMPNSVEEIAQRKEVLYTIGKVNNITTFNDYVDTTVDFFKNLMTPSEAKKPCIEKDDTNQLIYGVEELWRRERRLNKLGKKYVSGVKDDFYIGVEAKDGIPIYNKDFLKLSGKDSVCYYFLHQDNYCQWFLVRVSDHKKERIDSRTTYWYEIVTDLKEVK